MQKNTTKASILIWAIFLSLIISVAFIQISTKINKNLKNNDNLLNNLKIDSEIKNNINNSIINRNFNDSILANWDKIIFDKTNELTIWLKQNETNLSKINSSTIVSFTILNWWPVKYINNSLSWIIVDTKVFITQTWDLLINNLWWSTKIKINLINDNSYLSEYLNYKIIKKIWNKEVIQSTWKIKNF